MIIQWSCNHPVPRLDSRRKMHTLMVVPGCIQGLCRADYRRAACRKALDLQSRHLINIIA